MCQLHTSGSLFPTLMSKVVEVENMGGVGLGVYRVGFGGLGFRGLGFRA